MRWSGIRASDETMIVGAHGGVRRGPGARIVTTRRALLVLGALVLVGAAIGLMRASSTDPMPTALGIDDASGPPADVGGNGYGSFADNGTVVGRAAQAGPRRTFYVSPRGRDSNSGSRSRPW